MGNLVFQAASGGQVALSGPNTASSYTIAVPAITGTLVTTGDTGTVTTTMLASTTGSGAVVLATSPTLVTPALGTPSSVTLTNATGLPISTGLSGLTTNGVAYATSSTALATGSALQFDGTTFSTTTNAAFGKYSGAAWVSVGDNSSGNGSLRLFGGSSQKGWQVGSNISVANALEFGLATTNGGTTFTNQMILTGSGYLGIGTNSPSASLDVQSPNASNSIRLTATTGTNGAYQTFNNTGNTLYVGTDNSAGNALGFGAYAAGMYSSTKIVFQSASASNSLTLDTSGNLGLGVTPSAWGGGVNGLQVKDSTMIAYSGVNGYVGANAYYGTSGGSGFKYYGTNVASLYAQESGVHKFFNAASGTAGNAITFTQAMTLDTSGNLFVGVTTSRYSAGSATVYAAGIGDNRPAMACDTNLTTSQQQIKFINPNGIVGTIATSGSVTSYNVASDQRLKTNIVDAPQGNIDAIKVRSFDWIVDNNHQEYGMIAQELLEVAPYAVHVPTNTDEMMGVDYSKLVPMMIKEIQSLKAEVAKLKGV